MALRVGIVGKRGLAFAPAFRSSPECDLLALCELDPAVREREAAAHRIPATFEEYEDLLDAVDAVVVATPMHLHAPR